MSSPTSETRGKVTSRSPSRRTSDNCCSLWLLPMWTLRPRCESGDSKKSGDSCDSGDTRESSDSGFFAVSGDFH